MAGEAEGVRGERGEGEDVRKREKRGRVVKRERGIKGEREDWKGGEHGRERKEGEMEGNGRGRKERGMREEGKEGRG